MGAGLAKENLHAHQQNEHKEIQDAIKMAEAHDRHKKQEVILQGEQEMALVVFAASSNDQLLARYPKFDDLSNTFFMSAPNFQQARTHIVHPLYL